MASVCHGRWEDGEAAVDTQEEDGSELPDSRAPRNKPMRSHYVDIAEYDTGTGTCTTASISTAADTPCFSLPPTPPTPSLHECELSSASAVSRCSSDPGPEGARRGAGIFGELRHARRQCVIAANRLDKATGGMGAGVNNGPQISKIYYGLTPKLCMASRDLGSLMK